MIVAPKVKTELLIIKEQHYVIISLYYISEILQETENLYVGTRLDSECHNFNTL